MRRDIAYKITIPKTLSIPTFLKCGIADSTKEASTIEVKTTKTKSRKNHNKNMPRSTKTARIIVLVVIEIVEISAFSNIEISYHKKHPSPTLPVGKGEG